MHLYLLLMVLTIHLVGGDVVWSDLFNLTEDAYEYTDLYSDTAYQGIIDDLKNEAAKYFDAIKDPDAPDGDLKKPAWAEAGGVVSWIDEEEKLREDITVKYSYNDAPNIVFTLVDDWGWNDIGYQSTYISFTTPHVDILASEGIKLGNYYSSFLCTPARTSLLSGRYPLRYGMYWEKDDGELPLDEYTIAEELQSAGYKTYMVGKWHIGFSSVSRTPTYRGFDYFYGYYNGHIDYYTKEYGEYQDLSENGELVTDTTDLDNTTHSAILFQTKVEKVLASHSESYDDQPFFLYYSLQLMHTDWAADQIYIDRCKYEGSDADTDIYCGMSLMLDEVIGNLTCALDRYGFSDNTILIVASDNGGDTENKGGSYPFLGAKGSTYRGGVSVPAFIHSKLIPESRRGSTYDGNVHVTDWLPSLMNVATNGEWSGSFGGSSVVIDGINVWDAIINDDDSPRTSIIHLMDSALNYSVQLGNYKLNYDCISVKNKHDVPNYTYSTDQYPNNSFLSCDVISLVDYNDAGDDASSGIVAVNTSHNSIVIIISIIIICGCLLYYVFTWQQELHGIKTSKSGTFNKYISYGRGEEYKGLLASRFGDIKEFPHLDIENKASSDLELTPRRRAAKQKRNNASIPLPDEYDSYQQLHVSRE